MVEGAVALDQAEAARVVVDEGRDRRLGGVAERAPDPFAGAGVHQQAVGIVQFGAEIVVEPMVVLAGEEHRGQRRHVEGGDRLAREQGHAHVDAGLLPGDEFEAERAGRRFAVEQRVNDDAVGRRVGRLDPEFAEERELLVDLRARADAEPARGQPIALAAAEKAVIARAEERDHLVHHVRRVERIMQAKAGEAEVDRQARRDLVVAVVEQVGRVGDRRGNAVAQHVDDDRPLVEMAEVEQLEPETGRRAGRAAACRT